MFSCRAKLKARDLSSARLIRKMLNAICRDSNDNEGTLRTQELKCTKHLAIFCATNNVCYFILYFERLLTLFKHFIGIYLCANSIEMELIAVKKFQLIPIKRRIRLIRRTISFVVVVTSGHKTAGIL